MVATGSEAAKRVSGVVLTSPPVAEFWQSSVDPTTLEREWGFFRSYFGNLFWALATRRYIINLFSEKALFAGDDVDEFVDVMLESARADARTRWSIFAFNTGFCQCDMSSSTKVKQSSCFSTTERSQFC